MDLQAALEQWQRILALPIVAGLFAILRRIHPLALLRRLLTFGIGVKERELLLAMVDAEQTSGKRWHSLYLQCQADLKSADEVNARLRAQLAARDDFVTGGTPND